MEYIYHLISDNVIEIISIVSSFQKALHISSSSKYMSICIFHASNLSICKSTRCIDLNNFLNVKKLKYSRGITINEQKQLTNFLKLDDLSIYDDNIPEHIYIEHLHNLTSFCLEITTKHVSKRKDLSLLLKHSKLRKLTLRYPNNLKSFPFVDCDKLTYLRLQNNGWGNADNMIPRNSLTNLENLELYSIEFNAFHEIHSLIKLTSLNLTFQSDKVRIIYLSNLVSLLMDSFESNINVIVQNLPKLTKLWVFHCEDNDLNLLNLPKLKDLYLNGIKNINISNVKNLETVEIEHDGISKDNLFTFCEMNCIKSLKMDDFEYGSDADKRILQLKQEKMVIYGEYNLNEFYELQRLKRLTHLVLINNNNIKNALHLDHLLKLTIGYEEYLSNSRKVIVEKNVQIHSMTIQAALLKYGRYIL